MNIIFQKMRREENFEHEKENIEEHLKQILGFTLSLEKEFSCLKTEIKENQEVAEKLSEQDKKFAEIMKKINSLEDALNKLTKGKQNMTKEPGYVLKELDNELGQH